MMDGESKFLHHSDDGLFVLHCKDGVLIVEKDISSCDSSNSSLVFDKLEKFVPEEFKRDIHALVTQCTKCVVIGYGPTKLKFKPNGPFEYSGTTLTTVLNNIASLCIDIYIYNKVDFRNMTIKEAEREIRTAMVTCGWKCTMDFCTYFEQSSFLKTFPVMTVYGRWDAALELGVFLRSMGQTKTELPGSGDLVLRARKFMRDWALGLMHVGRHPMVLAIEQNWSGGDQAIFNSRAMSELSKSTQEPLDPMSICLRYGIAVSDYFHTTNALSMLDIGYTYRDSVIDSIMHKDYGVPLP